MPNRTCIKRRRNTSSTGFLRTAKPPGDLVSEPSLAGDPTKENELLRGQPSKPPKARIHAVAEGKIAVEVVTGGESPMATFGTEDPHAINSLLNQVLAVLCPGKAWPPDEGTINAVLAMLHGISPGDAVEGMIATQLVLAQHATMDVMRRGLHPDQTPEGRRLYLNLATRLMATFALQVQTLNQGRGRGPVQRVLVERVNIAAGAQAVVGAVTGVRTKGGGG